MKFWKAASLPGPANYIGRTFDVNRIKVTVEEVLAEGGFAVVFKVKQGNRRLALKRLLVNDPDNLAACKREIHILSELSDHKNIVSHIAHSVHILDNGTTEILILMEFCQTSVANQLVQLASKRQHLSEQAILHIFCDVCEAISRLHQCKTPIVHRDLKAENILLSDSGAYVLCDFGSATPKFMDPSKISKSIIEDEIQKFTTLSYRAPEMLSFYDGYVISTKADIWALGCLLYKLCFFQLPFGESSLAIQNNSYSIPDNSQYSNEIHALINYLLQPDPSNRPDIWQISYLAFELSNKDCPVINLARSAKPSFFQKSPVHVVVRVDEPKQQVKSSTSNSESLEVVPPAIPSPGHSRIKSQTGFGSTRQRQRKPHEGVVTDMPPPSQPPIVLPKHTSSSVGIPPSHARSSSLGVGGGFFTDNFVEPSSNPPSIPPPPLLSPIPPPTKYTHQRNWSEQIHPPSLLDQLSNEPAASSNNGAFKSYKGNNGEACPPSCSPPAHPKDHVKLVDLSQKPGVKTSSMMLQKPGHGRCVSTDFNNPFAQDQFSDSIEDFGQRQNMSLGDRSMNNLTDDDIFFSQMTKLRRKSVGSNTSLCNVKSREDLVMAGVETSPQRVVPSEAFLHAPGIVPTVPQRPDSILSATKEALVVEKMMNRYSRLDDGSDEDDPRAVVPIPLQTQISQTSNNSAMFPSESLSFEETEDDQRLVSASPQKQSSSYHHHHRVVSMVNPAMSTRHSYEQAFDDEQPKITSSSRLSQPIASSVTPSPPPNAVPRRRPVVRSTSGLIKQAADNEAFPRTLPPPPPPVK